MQSHFDCVVVLFPGLFPTAMQLPPYKGWQNGRLHRPSSGPQLLGVMI